MFYLYILKSVKYDKTYVGSSNDVERRLKEHNSGKSKFTSRFMPWRVVFSEEYELLSEARSREEYFKSGAGRKKIGVMLCDRRSSNGRTTASEAVNLGSTPSLRTIRLVSLAHGLRPQTHTR